MTENPCEKCLSDPVFWEMFCSVLCDEKNLLEFSEVSQIPVERIRQKRLEYIYRRFAPHIHLGNSTIN